MTIDEMALRVLFAKERLDGKEPTYHENEVALAETANVLTILAGNGIANREMLVDFFHGHSHLVREVQGMDAFFRTGKAATFRDGVWHCPACGGRVKKPRSYCHQCGKKLAWGKE